MKLVADTNVLFTFFWKDAAIHKMLESVELISPEFALVEINQHSSEIQAKAGLSPAEFKEQRSALVQHVLFVSLDEYAASLRTAAKGMPAELLEDIDFLALAVHTKLPLWSNDTHLKSQSSVVVLTTTELIKLLA